MPGMGFSLWSNASNVRRTARSAKSAGSMTPCSRSMMANMDALLMPRKRPSRSPAVSVMPISPNSSASASNETISLSTSTPSQSKIIKSMQGLPGRMPHG